MVTVKLVKGTCLNVDATRKKLEENGFQGIFTALPEKVKVRLTKKGEAMHKDRPIEEITGILCACFVEQ